MAVTTALKDHMDYDAAPGIADTYKDLFEDAPVAYHELDACGLIRRVNRAECLLLGYAQEEMIGRPIWDFIAGEECEASQKLLARKLSGEQPLAPFRRQYVTRDQRHVLLEIHDRLIRGPDGKAIGIRSALIDVTERVAAEAALCENQRWLSTLLRSLVDGVIAIDALGLVKFMNPAAEKLTGWRQAEAAGRDIDEVLTLYDLNLDAVSHDALNRLLRKGLVENWTRVLVLCSRDGAQRCVELTSNPIMTDHEVVFGIVLMIRSSTVAL